MFFAAHFRGGAAMRRTTCAATVIVLILTFFSATDGCARTSPATCPTAAMTPFMGVPNDASLTLGQVDTTAPPALRDEVVVTRVEDTSYGTYAGFREQGRIVREEEVDGYRFFAVEDTRTVFSRPRGEVDLKVTRRFSTRLDPRVQAYVE